MTLRNAFEELLTDAQLRATPVPVSGEVTLTTAPVLGAGSALIGNVGIDQTIPYTTNAVGIPDLTASGSITANAQTVTLALNGCGSVWLQITGPFSAILNFEGTVDGTTYFYVYGQQETDSTPGIATNSAAGNWQFPVSGLSSMRVRCSSYTSGTAIVTMRGSAGSGSFRHISVSQWGGSSVALGNGTQSGGILRVSIASDSTGQVAAIGKAAAGATISGAPVLNGAAARTANPTAVTDGQVANLMVDKLGKQVVVSALRELVGMQTTTITSSTAETTIVSAIASTFCDITHIDITNTSDTATVISLKDSTAGTTRATYALGAGGALALDFSPPMPQLLAVNNNWTLTSSASVASLYVNASYIKNT